MISALGMIVAWHGCKQEIQHNVNLAKDGSEGPDGHWGRHAPGG
jgi:hypothetical protein